MENDGGFEMPGITEEDVRYYLFGPGIVELNRVMAERYRQRMEFLRTWMLGRP